MYEELIARLRDDNAWRNCDFDFIYWWMHEAADAIEELSAYAKLYEELTDKGQKTARKLLDAYPRWISVEERLPRVKEDGFSEDVYVTDGTDIEKTQLMMAYDGMTGWGYTGIGKITHWCERIPLPEPPKEET